MNIHFDADIFQLIHSMPVNDIKEIADTKLKKKLKQRTEKESKEGLTRISYHILYIVRIINYGKTQKRGRVFLQNKELDLNVSINIATNGKSKNKRNMIEH